jgi:plasmid maintenance system antidote protein VapI
VASKDLSQVADQPELALAREPAGVAVPIELVRAQRSAAAAFALACSVSGLEDKEVYLSLGIDAGYFARIKKGEATLQADMMARFCSVVGNTVYMDWLAYQIGCTLVMVKTEAERRAEAAEKRAQEAELKVRVLMEAIGGRLPA